MEKRKVRKHLFSNILSVLMLGLCGFLIYNVYVLDIFPIAYFAIIAAIVGLIALIVFLIHIKPKKYKFFQFVSTVLVIVLFITSAFGNYLLVKVPDMFETLTSLSGVSSENVSIYTMKGKNVHQLSDLSGSIVGTIKNVDPVGTKEMLKATSEKGVDFQEKDYESTLELAQALYDGKVGSIILNSNYMDMILQFPEFENFKEDTRRVFALDFQKDSDLNAKNLKTNKMVPEPFTVLVSGNDALGELSEDAIDESMRSDANLIITVNPETSTILMTSIPRDLYLEIGVEGYEGAMDKLTHTGLLGVSGTEQTIEKALGIEIDYVARVNFSSMIELVDALGGVDLEISEKVAEEAQGNNPEETGADITFIKGPGKVHVNGRQALDFSRERYCFTDGDLQRNANQQTVLKAIINKATQPSTMLRYGKILDTVSNVFRTNMPSNVMKSLIRFEIVAHPNWKFERSAIMGEPTMEHCYLLGAVASVVIPDVDTMDSVVLKIEAVLNGESADSVGLPMDEEVEETEEIIE